MKWLCGGVILDKAGKKNLSEEMASDQDWMNWGLLWESLREDHSRQRGGRGWRSPTEQ